LQRRNLLRENTAAQRLDQRDKSRRYETCQQPVPLSHSAPIVAAQFIAQKHSGAEV
jgi:hypothetical protein